MKLPDGTYDNDIKFIEYQTKWQETKDPKWLWEMYPLYLHAIKSCMVKRLKGQRVPAFNEKAEAAALYQISWHLKDKNRKVERLMGYASFLAMRALYGKEAEALENKELSYDELVETGYYINNNSYNSFEDDIIEQLTNEGY